MGIIDMGEKKTQEKGKLRLCSHGGI